MKLYFESRTAARAFKANSKNPANKQLVDNGKESAKRWAVAINPVK